jgi:AraC-like DNA-binding protein
MDSPIQVAFFKMKMQVLKPHPSISNYVSHVVVLEDGDIKSDILIPLIAKGYPSIAFQTTAASSIAGRNNVANSLVLYGQNLKPFEFHASGHLTIIAYFLYPHLLKTFFGFNAHEAAGLSADLSQSQTARTTNLKEQLINELSLAKRLELMTGYVLSLSKLIRTTASNSISYATRKIECHHGLVALEAIEKELNMTERTFQRLFKLNVGVSPKTFSRICQFQSAFQHLSTRTNPKLADIAYETGFADQSHFNRAFKEFTNYSPSDYLKLSANF